MSAVLFSPHQDDESLFAAAICLRYRPHVIIVLRSMFQHRFGITAEMREAESSEALAILGCTLEQWPCPDIRPDWIAIETCMRDYDGAESPEIVFAPAYSFEENGHSFEDEERPLAGVLHHDMVGALAERVFGERVRFYQTYTRWGGRVREGERIQLASDEALLKQAALNCYQSQIGLESTSHHFQGPHDEEWMQA